MKIATRGITVLEPFNETISDSWKFQGTFGNNYFDTFLEVFERDGNARLVQIGLQQRVPAGTRVAYEAMFKIMNSKEDYVRLALYMPFGPDLIAMRYYHSDYMRAWKELISHEDVRESFNIGDIYEPEARKGEPERVVKCFHLIPWLLKYGVVTHDDISYLFYYAKNRLQQSSIYDCCKGQMSSDLAKLKKQFDKSGFDYVPPKSELLYETEARKAWLKRREKIGDEGMSEKARKAFLKRIVTPFSQNFQNSTLPRMLPELTEFLKPDEVVLIGGSRIKGYSLNNSDCDIFLHKLSDFENPDPNEIHKVFNMIWVSNDPKIEKKRAEIAAKYMKLPAGSLERKQCLSRLEADLLQFRLMHEGFPRAFGKDLSVETRDLEGIDGASAFYDPRYREAASILYSKYVFLPQM